MKRTAIALGLVLFLACGHAPQIHYYRLDYDAVEPEPTATENLQLYILPFNAASIYQQEKMIYQPSPYEIRFDHYRRWIDAPVHLMHQNALDYFRACGTFGRVSDRPLTGDNTILLQVELLDCKEVVQEETRMAVFSIWARFWHHSTQEVLWEGLIREQQRIEKSGGQGIAHATTLASKRVFKQLLSRFLQK